MHQIRLFQLHCGIHAPNMLVYLWSSLEYSGIHATDMLVLFDACDRYACFIGLHAVIAILLCCNLALCLRHDTGS